MNKTRIISSVILAFSIALAGYWAGNGLSMNARMRQTLEVVGSAKKDIRSDLGILRTHISTEHPTAQGAYEELNRQLPKVLAYFKSKGFDASRITLHPASMMVNYQMMPNGMMSSEVRSYTYQQRIEVQSNQVQQIREVSLDIASLIEQGINLNLETADYYYTRLSELKVEIQAEAAKDARNRAQKIAEATGSSLGEMTRADMGVLQITPKNSNNISDYGINDNSSIEKEITAVVHASFILD